MHEIAQLVLDALQAVRDSVRDMRMHVRPAEQRLQSAERLPSGICPELVWCATATIERLSAVLFARAASLRHSAPVGT